ncbi:hypothetical protein LTR56_001521 [Elasticomyces elasticus]|nr:hypothetical protein LTR56_001521 [Elasticomyces elasticus]KAK3668557.1 hypothetical protein LTR22_000444 [Elasticomyces elasticus]KAK4931909.1 hypothetical protein LTR49_001596 [Elasticomyces elasticus]KAK5768560.1 hypothetical protein LTS12_001348 [Elasticomyces elasticus]
MSEDWQPSLRQRIAASASDLACSTALNVPRLAADLSTVTGSGKRPPAAREASSSSPSRDKRVRLSPSGGLQASLRTSRPSSLRSSEHDFKHFFSHVPSCVDLSRAYGDGLSSGNQPLSDHDSENGANAKTETIASVESTGGDRSAPSAIQRLEQVHQHLSGPRMVAKSHDPPENERGPTEATIDQPSVVPRQRTSLQMHELPDFYQREIDAEREDPIATVTTALDISNAQTAGIPLPLGKPATTHNSGFGHLRSVHSPDMVVACAPLFPRQMSQQPNLVGGSNYILRDLHRACVEAGADFETGVNVTLGQFNLGAVMRSFTNQQRSTAADTMSMSSIAAHSPRFLENETLLEQASSAPSPAHCHTPPRNNIPNMSMAEHARAFDDGIRAHKHHIGERHSEDQALWEAEDEVLRTSFHCPYTACHHNLAFTARLCDDLPANHRYCIHDGCLFATAKRKEWLEHSLMPHHSLLGQIP